MSYMVVIHFPLRISTNKIIFQFCVFRQSRIWLLFIFHWEYRVRRLWLTFAFSDNRGQNSWHTDVKTWIFLKMHQLPSTIVDTGLPLSPCSMLFFPINLDRWRSISAAKKYSQHWIGGGGTLLLIFNEKWKVCQEFCPRLSERRFPPFQYIKLCMQLWLYFAWLYL